MEWLGWRQLIFGDRSIAELFRSKHARADLSRSGGLGDFSRRLVSYLGRAHAWLGRCTAGLSVLVGKLDHWRRRARQDDRHEH